MRPEIAPQTASVLDTHVHVWRLADGGYEWLSAPQWEPIRHDYWIEDLRSTLSTAAVPRALLVQAEQSDTETDRLLGLADDPLVAGVVGWVALEDTARLQERLVSLRTHSALVGIRHLVGWPLEGDVLSTGSALPGLRLVADAGLVLEVMPQELSDLDDVAAVADRLPGLTIVVDHLAKPRMDGRGRDEWAAAMTKAARHSNVVTKVSGWTTPAPSQLSGQALRPFVEHAVEVFGVERLMYGSNWPVTLVADSYRRMWEETLDALSWLTTAEQGLVLGGNADRWYRLPPAHSK